MVSTSSAGSGRRTEILDTALRLIADGGMRGLTHRAVDRAAALPAGSTSYYFRTRDALVTGCLRRLLDLDKAQAAEPAASAPPPDMGAGTMLDQLVEQAVSACVRMATTDGKLTLARYELSLHATRSPELHEALVAAGTELRALIADHLAALGAPTPGPAAEELAAVLDGLVYTALIRGPRQDSQLREWLRPAIRRVLSAHTQSTGR